jgi:serine/threonine protein kinase
MKYPFTNLRRLCAGGNGDLYIGNLRANGAIVIVKLLREYSILQARKGFAREVRMLARRIPGLVPLLFADTEGVRPFYVMPFLKGGALTRYAGRLTDDQLQKVAGELARTIANLHAAFEVHGDVKPDNILVSHDGRIQVADPLGNGTLFTILFAPNHGGTPGYWAPEIRAGAPISYAGDVYSFGATLYHLKTGRRPQDGERLEGGLQAGGSSAKIWEIIDACCQFNPRSRPSMQEVLLMLRGVPWADIVEQKRQRLELLKVVGVVGIGILAIAAVTSGAQG